MDLYCELCPGHEYPNITSLLRHLCILHKNSIDFVHHCPFHGCFRKNNPFRTYTTLQRHVTKFHPQFESISEPPSGSEASDLQSLQEHVEDESQRSNPETERICSDVHQAGTSSAQPTQPQEQVGVRRLQPLDVAMSMFDLEQASYLTQVDLDRVVSLASNLLGSALRDQVGDMQEMCKEDGIIVSDKLRDKLLENANITVNSLFRGLSTSAQRKKLLEKDFDMVTPQLKYLPQTDAERCQGQRRRSFAYVPIIEQIQLFLNNPTLAQELTRNLNSSESVGRKIRSDVVSGERYQALPVDSEAELTLVFLLYYDDLECCNPLGSRSKVHKLGMFYSSLVNLEAKFRSSLCSINLACVAKTEDIKRDSMDVILEPLVRDLQTLEEGVLMKIDNRDVKVNGRIGAIVADNLGSHILAGFKEGFTAIRFCRFCLTLNSNMHGRSFEHQFTLRDKETHVSYCAEIRAAETPGLMQHLSKVYGVNRDTILNELRYFHVTDAGISPDIMHDILLGVLPLTLKGVLQQFIVTKKYFTLRHLNAALKEFKYGSWEVKSKPAIIDPLALTERGHIRQSASQCWRLGVILPLLVGAFIPSSDKTWQCYLSLLEICRIVFAPQVSEEMIAVLEVTIARYLSLYVSEIKPRLIPKQHNLVHYPRLIHLLGPLCHVWAMRFEAKNGWFKKLARTIGNYTNLPFTVASCQQRLQALHVHNFGREPLVRDATNGRTALVASMPWGGELGIQLGAETLVGLNVVEVSRVQVRSLVYKAKSGFLIARVNEGDGLPQFGLVSNIYLHKEKVFFNLEMWKTERFSEKFQAFRIVPRKAPNSSYLSHYSIIPFDSLRDTTFYHDHPVYRGARTSSDPYLDRGAKYIVLRAYVGGFYEGVEAM